MNRSRRIQPPRTAREGAGGPTSLIEQQHLLSRTAPPGHQRRRPARATAWGRLVLLALPATLAFGLVACQGEGDEGEDRPATVVVLGEPGTVSISGVVEGYGEELYEASSDQTVNLAIGLDLRDIREIMSSAVGDDPVDWAAATAIYENGQNQTMPDGSVRSLADIAAQASTLAFPDGPDVYGRENYIDGIIRDGLTGEGRAAGLGDNARRQIVDKGIQMLMYGESLARLQEAEEAMASGDGTAAAEAIDAAWATLAGQRDESGTPNNGILATGVAREEDFSFQGRLSRPLEASLYSAATSALQDNPERFTAGVAASRGYLNTIGYLSTLRFGPVIQGDARASDREVHLAEGWASFQAIRATVASASPDAAATIDAAYSADPGEKFSEDATTSIYTALNEPDVLAALGIPEEFHVQAP